MEIDETILENEEAAKTADSHDEKAQPESTSAEAKSEPKDIKKEKKAFDKEAKKLKAELEKLSGELTTITAKAADFEDKYMRVAAEYDNFRKRSRQERDGIYADATADCIKELLPLIDNLQRATQFAEADKVTEGVQMIVKGLPEIFEKLGIASFGKPGEQFDPNIHNAIMHEENPEKGENEIVAVFQEGYKLGDKVIRYAMVTVAN